MAKPTRITQEMIDEYLSRGLWVEDSIRDILKQNATKYPHDEALVDFERRLTWAQLDQMSDSVALSLMEMGIERDHALLCQVPNPSICLILLMACQKAGILCCFPPMTFRFNELKHVIKTLHAVAVVTPGNYRDTSYHKIYQEIASEVLELKHIVISGNNIPCGTIPFNNLLEQSDGDAETERRLALRAFGPFEVSIVVFSSGTTGMPKCIEHTGANSRSGGWGVVERAKLTHEDIIGNIAPLSGGPGMQNWWAAFQVGAKVCMMDRFSPEEVLRLIERERVTYLAAIPTQLVRILKETDTGKYDLSSLRVVRTGAASFDADLARETEDRLNCKVLIAGGSQETYSFAQTGVEDSREKRLKTLGRPFPGNEIKIADDEGHELPEGEVGNLFVRGAATSAGYFGNLEATLSAWCQMGKEGWYGTGDLAGIDEEGYLVIAGRKKEIIIRGGHNIYPGEIENLLVTHPKIMQAVVLGFPDQVMGERACACVTLSKGDSLDLEEIVSFLKEKGLAIHKLPERLEIFDQFPQLVDGQKVNKVALKGMLMETIGR